MSDLRDVDRRTFLGLSVLMVGNTATGLLKPDAGHWLRIVRTRSTHPFLYVSRGEHATAQSIDQLSRSIQSGHAKKLWDSIREEATADLDAPLIMPDSPIEGRSPATIAQRNLDFYVCNAAGQRIKRQAMVYLLTGDYTYCSSAVEQIEAILDQDRWPDWIDQAHIRFGHPAGLRTGMLANDIGLAYDWLYHGLTPGERNHIAKRLDDRGIEPFRISLTQDPWWMRDLNNWTTTIVGGVAVAAMAIEDRIPDAPGIIDLASKTFERYLQIYGRSGEFNESPAYANATVRPVAFFRAVDDWRGNRSDAGGRLANHPFPDTATWLRYMTLPSGHTAAFGDSHVDALPWTKHLAAIAAAANDPVLQDFYLANARGGDAEELAWFDPALDPKTPTGMLPLGRHFPDQGGCFSVRGSWDSDHPQICVYGKTGREENHEHNDAGQICIDVGKERMIVDPGSPSSYPEDFFDEGRWAYYNASIIGHNVVQVGGLEQRVPDWERGDGPPEGIASITGHMVDSEFSDEWGGRLLMDTTRAYVGADRVRRAVIVLHSGIVAVLDEVQLPEAAPILLRWHTIDRAAVTANGSFVVRGERAALACRVVAVSGTPIPGFARREHSYAPPYDRARTGELLEARNESYVEVAGRGGSVKWLSVFASVRDGSDASRWDVSGGVASIVRDGRTAAVSFDGETLRVSEGAIEQAQPIG
ncbi:MAG: heparinase II/III family protein [Rhodothermales bacterium]